MVGEKLSKEIIVVIPGNVYRLCKTWEKRAENMHGSGNVTPADSPRECTHQQPHHSRMDTHTHEPNSLVHRHDHGFVAEIE